MSDILNLSAVELRDAIAAGEVSARQATEAYLAAIEATDPQIGAYNEVHAESALAEAKRTGREPPEAGRGPTSPRPSPR